MILEHLESDDKGSDTCPSCGALLGIETPKLGCEDPDGCGLSKESLEYEEEGELDFDE